MLCLMFVQSRVCASAASFIQARDISSLGPTSTKVGARRQRHLPRDLDRVVVEHRAALLRIELVAAALEHFLGRLVRRTPAACGETGSTVSPGDTRYHTASESANVGRAAPTAAPVGKQLSVGEKFARVVPRTRVEH